MKLFHPLRLLLALLLSVVPVAAQGQHEGAAHEAVSAQSTTVTTSSTHPVRSVQSDAPTTASSKAAEATTNSSANDWCAAHEVPESKCTRCNKSLIPAFKAAGDWCAAHDLPESQCRACNPKLEITHPSGGK